MTVAIRSVGIGASSANSVATPTTLVCQLPATRVTGDTLLIFTACRSNVPTVATPAGWTKLAELAATNGRIVVFGRRVDGTEANTNVVWSGLTTGTSGTPCTAAIVCMSGLLDDIANLVDVVGASTDLTSSTQSAGGAAVTTIANVAVFSITTRLDDTETWSDPTIAGVAATFITENKTTSGADMGLRIDFANKSGAGSAAAVTWALSGATSFASSGVQLSLKAASSIIVLSGDVTGTGGPAGALSVAVPASGDVVGSGALTGQLGVAVPLSGGVTGVGDPEAALQTLVALAGAVAGGGSLTGGLVTVVGLSGDVAGAGSLAGTLAVVVPVTGQVAGSGALAGSLALVVPVAGDVIGAGGPAGQLAVAVPLSGQLAGAGDIAGDLTVESGPSYVELGGLVAGSAALAGEVGSAVSLAGDIAGESGPEAQLAALVTLAGALQGEGLLAGALEEPQIATGLGTGGRVRHVHRYGRAGARSLSRSRVEA